MQKPQNGKRHGDRLLNKNLPHENALFSVARGENIRQINIGETVYDWKTERDLVKRKNKKNLTSHKTQSTLSNKNGKISKIP
ncbi:MAG: hypothetical protein J5817_04335 [Treponema sp.]|nr:hypothetical protein [Treponema sp.]